MKRTLSERQALWLPVFAGIIVVATFVAVQLRYTQGELGAPLDDAWIHFQFARNLSHGNGFSYNPGQPTPGSTAPLWTILLAFPAYFSDNLLLPGLILSSLFLLASIYITARFTLDLSGKPQLALLAGLAVALTGRMVWAGWSAMEASAFAFLSLLAVRHFTRHGMTAITALLMGVASQLRPEAHALFALAGISWFLSFFWHVENRNAAAAKRFAKQAAIALAVYGLIVLPYTLFSLSVTGKPLPNTFYAKANRGFSFSLRTLRETLAYQWQDNPVAMVLLPFGLLALWRKSRLSALWLVGLPLFVALIIGQTFHHGRYTLPLIPFQMLAAVMAVDWLIGWVRRRSVSAESSTNPKTKQQLPFLILAALLLIGGGLGLPRWARMLGKNSREIIEIDVAIGRWLAENSDKDALIAVDDIGAIGYLSQRRLLDLNGLISPEMWPALQEPIGLKRNQIATRLISQVEPSYVAIFPNWHYEIAFNRSVLTPVKRFSAESRTMIADTEAIVYSAEWPYLKTAQPSHQSASNFDAKIALIGYDLAQSVTQLDIVLYWQSIAVVDLDYAVFIHLLDQDGTIVAQTDGQPLDLLAPTSLWQPGDLIRDPRQLVLPSDLAAGSYQLTLGLYDRESGQRLPLVESAENKVSAEMPVSADSVLIQEITFP